MIFAAKPCRDSMIGKRAIVICKSVGYTGEDLACTKEYRPVCMANGKEYGNLCTMCAELNQDEITLKNCGKCQV